MNTFSFCMSESEFTSPSWLKYTFAGYRILDCHLKIFSILLRCCYTFLSLALFWGSRWGGRWEGGSGWGRHVNPRPFHFNVWQNSLQIKKKKRINMLQFLNLFLGFKCVFSSSGWSYNFLIIVLKPYWTWLCRLTSLLFTLGFLHLHIVLLEVVPSAYWCSIYLFCHPFDFGLFYIFHVST